MAHIVASITASCKRTAIISAAKVRHCKRKIASMPVPLPREWRPTGHVFLASSCLLPPNKDLLYLIEGRLLIEQIQATVFSNRFVRDRYARAKRAGGC